MVKILPCFSRKTRETFLKEACSISWNDMDAIYRALGAEYRILKVLQGDRYRCGHRMRKSCLICELFRIFTLRNAKRNLTKNMKQPLKKDIFIQNTARIIYFGRFSKKGTNNYGSSDFNKDVTKQINDQRSSYSVRLTLS